MNDALSTDHTEYTDIDARATIAFFNLIKMMFGDEERTGPADQPSSNDAVIE